MTTAPAPASRIATYTAWSEQGGASGISIAEDTLLQFADRVHGKVVLITGAGSGFGKAVALIFAEHGAKVVAVDLNKASAEATAEAIKAAGGAAIAHECDVRSWDSQAAVFAAAVAEYGAIHVVLANAGIADVAFQYTSTALTDGPPTRPNLNVLDVNLTGVMYTTHLALHYLNRNPAGDLKTIVITASMASFMPLNGAPVYAVAKTALAGLVRTLVREAKRVGIVVTSVHPGFANTPILPQETQARLTGAGLALVPVPLVANVLFRAATEPEADGNGAMWILKTGTTGVQRVDSLAWGAV